MLEWLQKLLQLDQPLCILAAVTDEHRLCDLRLWRNEVPEIENPVLRIDFEGHLQ